MNCNNNPEKIGAVHTDFFICLFLFIVIFSVYLPVIGYPFTIFDDNLYVTDNPWVRSGISLENIKWALGLVKTNNTYWHPLTWLSHMLDCSLFGLNAGMHHLTSLLFHAVNSILLFLVFRKMTGTMWRSAFVAVLFALHPVNADSVVWIAERKNLLSTFFWLLTMYCYFLYTQKPSLFRYAVTCFAFICGLLAKPMLVTLPFVLLLLDFWPVRRTEFRFSDQPETVKGGSISFSFLLKEKIPLILLSVVSVFVFTSSQQNEGIMVSTEAVPMILRLENAVVSYVCYIGKMIWPQNLAIHYPYPNVIPLWQFFASLFVLTCLTVLAVFCMKTKPYFLTGWLWFTGTLVPVSGLVQAGLWPAMADRWAYVPFIGLFVIFSWGIWDMTEGRRYQKKILAGMASFLILFLLISTRIQIGYWKDDIALFTHAIEVTKDNSVAHNNLGTALGVLGSQEYREKALWHFYEAVRIDPDSAAGSHINIGVELTAQNRYKEAFHHFSEALRTGGEKNGKLYFNMGNAMFRMGRYGKAADYYRKAIEIDPEDPNVYNDLGVALATSGNFREAIIYFSAAHRIAPDDMEIRNNLIKAEVALQKSSRSEQP